MREDCMSGIFDALYEISIHALQDVKSLSIMLEQALDCVQRLVPWADISFVFNERYLKLIYGIIANPAVCSYIDYSHLNRFLTEIPKKELLIAYSKWFTREWRMEAN